MPHRGLLDANCGGAPVGPHGDLRMMMLHSVDSREITARLLLKYLVISDFHTATACWPTRHVR